MGGVGTSSRSAPCSAELGAPIAPSTYYDARRAGAAPSPRRERDAWLAGEVARVHAENYSVYGARKVWAQLNREGVAVARCTVERLMREHGLAGARRGRRVQTTIPGAEARAGDLVGREFNPPAPDRLWVADSERHEALLNRVEVGDLRRRAVAAVR